jgi:hypothetical protein
VKGLICSKISREFDQRKNMSPRPGGKCEHACHLIPIFTEHRLQFRN